MFHKKINITFDRRHRSECVKNLEISCKIFFVCKSRLLSQSSSIFSCPPYDNVKMVYSVAGKVLDVLVDLRLGSPVYGLPFKFELTDVKANVLNIPQGISHGFYTSSQSAIMVYKTSTIYNENYDSGILWSSFSIWPDEKPIVSNKDSSFLHLNHFQTPFKF